MPSDTETPEVSVVGPPILTVYFKNKRDDEDNPLAGAQPVMDFSVSGGALIAQAESGELMIFPLGELEYASLTPQLSIKEDSDAPSEGDSDRSGDDAAAEAAFEDEGGKLIIPNFGGSSAASEEGSD